MDHFLTHFLDVMLWNNILSSIKHKADVSQNLGSENGFDYFIELNHRTPGNLIIISCVSLAIKLWRFNLG